MITEGEKAVASLCGLVLRRLQDLAIGDDAANDDTAVKISDLNKIFGEALEQFSE